MARWTCAIAGDDAAFDRVEDLVVHQTREHDRIECAVCGAIVPDGYFALRHVFDEHSRREYVRAYEASPAEVRRREAVKDAVEETADLDEILARLQE